MSAKDAKDASRVFQWSDPGPPRNEEISPSSAFRMLPSFASTSQKFSRAGSARSACTGRR
jgi:hypothetical protein